MNIDFTTQSEQLAELWRSLIPDFCPSEYQFNLWLQLHDMNVDLIAWGIKELACKYHRKHGQMGQEHMVKFVSSVVNRKKNAVKSLRPERISEKCDGAFRPAQGTELRISRWLREDQQERGNFVR